MNIINENDGISSVETEALFSANKKDMKKFSFITKIKDKINMRKSEKILKKADVCKTLENNQR